MVQAPQEDWGSLLAAPQAEDDWGSLLTAAPPKPHSRKTGGLDLLGAARATGQFLESNLEQAVRGAEMATGQAAEFIGTHGEKALNVLFPGELTQAGKAARVQAAGEPGRAIQAQAQTHPEPQGYAQKLSGAAGGLVPYLTAEALTGGAATLPILGTMGGQHVDAAYEQAKAAGANEATATLAGLANVPGAIAMTLPLGRVLGRLSKEAPEVGTMFQEALHSAAAGTLGMGGARVTGDFIQEHLTNEDRDILGNALKGASLDAPLFALLGSSAGLAIDKSTSVEGSLDRVSAKKSEPLGNAGKSGPAQKEKLGVVDVPGQRVMLEHVLRSAQDPQVRESIIRSIPVEVMDVLRREQLSPDSPLNDKAMLQTSMAINLSPPVSVGGPGSVRADVTEPTTPSAEASTLAKGSQAQESGSAAQTGDLGLSIHRGRSAGVATEGLFGAPNLVETTGERLTTSATIQGQHGVTPESVGVSGAEGVSAPSRPESTSPEGEIKAPPPLPLSPSAEGAGARPPEPGGFPWEKPEGPHAATGGIRPLTRAEERNPLSRKDVRDELEGMAKEAGQGQRGGEVVTDPRTGERVTLPWAPRAEWWNDRPGNLTGDEVRNLVRKVIINPKAPLGGAQQDMLNWMLARITKDIPTREQAREAKAARLVQPLPEEPGMRGALDLFGPRKRGDPNAETDADRLYSGLVFDLHRIQKLAERALNQPKLKETMEETLSLFPGRKFGEMEKIDKQVVAPLKPLLREIGPDEAADYLMAKHVPDALKELARKGIANPSVGMDPAQAAEIVSKAENGPKAEAYKRLRAWNQMSNKRALDTMEKGFLISPETRKEWESRFGPDFVHLKSVPDPQAEEFFGPSGFTVTGPESKRREGRESKAGNPIAFRLMSLEQAVVRSEKNRIGNTLAAFVEANPGKLWRIVTDRNKVSQGEEALPYKVNGEQRYIVTGDKPLAQAFRRLIDPDPGVLRVVDPALNWLHNVIIKWNPGFQAYNIPRDVGTASSKQLMRGDFQAAAKTVAQAVPAAQGAFQAIRTEGAGGHWGDVYRRARDAGALIGWNQQLGYEKQIDAFEKATRPEGKARAFGQLMDDLNRAGELGTRLVTFEAALQNGKSESAAAMDARRITADFARRGRWAPVYRRLYLFSGANIQGTAELARSAAQNPAKAASVFGALIAAGYTSAALSHAFGDEKELEKLTPDEKDRFIGVMIGKRRYGVPAPYGFNFFTSLGWGLYDAQTGRDKGKVLADALESGINAFSPLPRAANVIQAVTPTLGRPLVEIAQNRDFSNRPIKPEISPFDVSPPPEHERYFRTVSPVSKAATQALAETTGVEVSPEVVDHLAKAVTGGLGTFGGRTLENARKVLNGETAGMRLQDWPGVGEVMRPFVREAPPSAQSSLMWTTVKKVQAVEGKIKDELKAGGERAAAAHKQMSQPEVRGAIQAAAFFKVIDKSLGTLRTARDSATTDEAKKDAERRIEELQSRFLDQARKFGVRLEMD